MSITPLAFNTILGMVKEMNLKQLDALRLCANAHVAVALKGPEGGWICSDKVKGLASSGKLIAAIKEFRFETGAGLKESKEAVEAYLLSTKDQQLTAKEAVGLMEGVLGQINDGFGIGNTTFLNDFLIWRRLAKSVDLPHTFGLRVYLSDLFADWEYHSASLSTANHVQVKILDTVKEYSKSTAWAQLQQLAFENPSNPQ
jgi:ribosomal protein L7/L12